MHVRPRTIGVCIVALFASATAATVAPTQAEAQRAAECRSLGLRIQRTPAGATVTAVLRGVGRSAGFAVGDVVYALSNERVNSAQEIDDELLSGPDTEHDVDVLRGTQHLHITVFRGPEGQIETIGRTPRLR